MSVFGSRDAGDRRGEVSAAGAARGDGRREFGEGVLFRHITGGTGGTGLADQIRVIVAQKNDNRTDITVGPKLDRGVDAMLLGNREIEDSDIGAVFER